VRWLIDTQLPVALARWLQARGEDAVHVLDLGQGQTGDRDIWETAIAENRIVISKDEDFFLLATRPGDSGRLLWLRVGNCRKPALLTTMDQAWPAVEAAFLGDKTSLRFGNRSVISSLDRPLASFAWRPTMRHGIPAFVELVNVAQGTVGFAMAGFILRR